MLGFLSPSGPPRTVTHPSRGWGPSLSQVSALSFMVIQQYNPAQGSKTSVRENRRKEVTTTQALKVSWKGWLRFRVWGRTISAQAVWIHDSQAGIEAVAGRDVSLLGQRAWFGGSARPQLGSPRRPPPAQHSKHQAQPTWLFLKIHKPISLNRVK